MESVIWQTSASGGRSLDQFGPVCPSRKDKHDQPINSPGSTSRIDENPACRATTQIFVVLLSHLIWRHPNFFSLTWIHNSRAQVEVIRRETDIHPTLVPSDREKRGARSAIERPSSSLLDLGGRLGLRPSFLGRGFCRRRPPMNGSACDPRFNFSQEYLASVRV